LIILEFKYITSSKNTYRRLSEEYINISLGIDEMIKGSWKIVDNNRTYSRVDGKQ
jgi:hypothetical protein